MGPGWGTDMALVKVILIQKRDSHTLDFLLDHSSLRTEERSMRQISALVYTTSTISVTVATRQTTTSYMTVTTERYRSGCS